MRVRRVALFKNNATVKWAGLMSDCVGQATKPLLRQIETLQSSLREVTGVWRPRPGWRRRASSGGTRSSWRSPAAGDAAAGRHQDPHPGPLASEEKFQAMTPDNKGAWWPGWTPCWGATAPG